MANSDLVNFFSSYFHQDWVEEARDTTDVVQSYVNTASLEEREALASDIENTLILGTWSDAELENHLYEQLGSYYDLTFFGQSARQWLREIVNQLRSR